MNLVNDINSIHNKAHGVFQIYSINIVLRASTGKHILNYNNFMILLKLYLYQNGQHVLSILSVLILSKPDKIVQLYPERQGYIESIKCVCK